MKRILWMLLCLALLCSACLAAQAEVPALTANSDIVGLADTGNKTSLKVDLIYTSGPGDINLYHYDENGNRVIYENEKEIVVPLEPVHYQGQAVLSFDGAVDDAKIDSENAVVRLLDGNSYWADEYLLQADHLTGNWENGQLVYTLTEGDLSFNTWDYDTTVDYNSNREFSIMGGDGNGVYFFTFEVSGITYDGEEVAPVTFPVAIYCYGRTCTDLSLSREYVENTVDPDAVPEYTAATDAQWLWVSANESAMQDGKPYMNDAETDYFVLVWPEGTDASRIQASDVQVTLRSKYGDEYVLSEETAYGEHEYSVLSLPDATVVAVTYQQWAYIPVYSTLEIDVAGTVNTWDVCSVAAYMVQTGGGGVTVDHTVTCYNYYGVEGMNAENAVNSMYTLSTVIDDKTWFYAEDEAGNAYLSEGTVTTNSWGRETVTAPADAQTFDGTEEYHVAVRGNVVFVETRVDSEEAVHSAEDHEVDGQMITFTRVTGFNRTISEMLSLGAKLVDGFNLNGAGPSQWAWTMRYQSGWTTLSPEPDRLPYVQYPYGYEPGQFRQEYVDLQSGAATDGAVSAGPGGPGGPG